MQTTTEVACGIIIENSKILVAQRGEKMKLPFKWELPGGKRKMDESLEECLVRELFEELRIKVRVMNYFLSSRYQYDFIKIELNAYFTEIEYGVVSPTEHYKVAWLNKEELPFLDWAPADIPIINSLIKTSYI